MNTATKKTMAALASLVAAAMLLTAAATALTAAPDKPEPSAALTMTQSSQSAYLVRSVDGYVAVFDFNKPGEPITETLIRVDGLRAVDRGKLEAGIPADSYEDVLKLLEDFGS